MDDFVDEYYQDIRDPNSNLSTDCCFKNTPCCIRRMNCLKNGDSEQAAQADAEQIDPEKKSKISYRKAYLKYVTSPKMCFCYETFFFFLFLGLFSYVLLCEFDFKQAETSNLESNSSIYNARDNNFTNFTNETTLLTNSSNFTLNFSSSEIKPQSKTITKNFLNMPGLAEIFLAFWVFTFLINEIIQVCRL